MNFALCMAAGLEGIADGLDPGEPHTDNLYLISERERKRRKIDTLPQTLDHAVQAFRNDKLSRTVFGDEMFEAWAEHKEQEWLSYLNHVSDWELERYLRFF